MKITTKKKGTKRKWPFFQNHCWRWTSPHPQILLPHNLHWYCASRSPAQSVFTPPLSPAPFDVPCCLYKINIDPVKMPHISLHLGYISWSPTFIRSWLAWCNDQTCIPTDVLSGSQQLPRGGVDRRTRWMPIRRCRSCPLMHIKPTPPACHTSHPASLVPGIWINCADRRPLCGPHRWII